MAVSLQVICPVGEETAFHYDYHATTIMKLVGEHMGQYLASAVVTKGLVGGGPGAPTPFHAVATMTFASHLDLGAAMAAAGPMIADLPNFTNSQAQMLVGEVIG